MFILYLENKKLFSETYATSSEALKWECGTFMVWHLAFSDFPYYFLEMLKMARGEHYKSGSLSLCHKH